ncbi:hypothetical protein IL306_003256 [Fusarium sp. DS 682]|nr:hypothetical protein IL306_003256 [Fusarium sp. DS 682]
MSGGDLDGDTFFVCWDLDLIPSTVAAPALYPGGKEPIQFRPITDDDRLVYFAKYQNASLGQVKNVYLDWARVAGPMSAQCQELNRLFSQCVDGNRIKIPDKLCTAPKPPPDAPPFILDVLHDDSKEWVRRLSLSKDGDLLGYNVDAIQLLLGREDVAISEFECVKLAYSWCLKNDTSFESLLHLFDLNVLTADQKAWVLAHVPASPSAQGLIRNALCSSGILERTELQHFHLDNPEIKWKRTYDSSTDRLATFHDAVATNLELFQRTLIVFQPDERLSLAIYIPKKIERSQDYVASMRNLDLWLEQIDTTETLPLFSKEPKEYSVPNRNDLLSPSDPPWLVDIVSRNDLSALTGLDSIDHYKPVFRSAQKANDKSFLLGCFEYILSNIGSTSVDPKELLNAMLEVLTNAPTIAVAFTSFLSSSRTDKDEDLVMLLEASLLPILRAFILSANTMGQLILEPFKAILSAITPGSLSLGDIADLVQLSTLTLRSTDLALDLFLDCLQPNAIRFMVADPEINNHLLRNLIGIALDHIEEANKVAKKQQGLFELKLSPKDKKGNLVEIDFRIDATGTPRTGSHVRLTTASLPSNIFVGNNYSIDALVVSSETGRARCECLHPLPPYFAECSWILEDCGPFVTSKSMIDAVRDLCTYKGDCCGVADIIIGLPPPALPAPERAHSKIERLNESQNQAIKLALNSSLLCLWGPPGTGKTETIVEMICALQTANEKARILVTAPTHNAVDNVMRRYIQRLQRQPLARKTQPDLVRVSTEVRKVADDLQRYTCDAMAGQEIHSDYKAMKKATQMVKRSDTVFTTCIGAGIGLLRSEFFNIVIVDEAS